MTLTGVFAVPKELCADMYIQAVSDFSAMEMRYPKELHIIDVDVSILKLVEISYKKWKKDPTSVQAEVTLKQYLIDNPTYQYSRGDEWKYQGKGQRKGRQFIRQLSDPDKGNFDSGTPKELDRAVVKGVGSEPLRWGGRSSMYNINDSVKVHVYTGKIEKVEDVDAVICGTDTYFGTNSYIARAFLQEFGDKYKRNFDKMKSKERNTAVLSYVYVCESGSLKGTRVMHLAMKPVMNGDRDELQDYKKGLSNIFRRAEKWKFGKIALPLLGTGKFCLCYCICSPALKKGELYRIWVVCHSVRLSVCSFIIIFSFPLNIFRTLLLNFTKFCMCLFHITKIYFGIITHHFSLIFTRVMALDLSQNFVSVQYIENKWTEFHQILYMHSY